MPPQLHASIGITGISPPLLSDECAWAALFRATPQLDASVDAILAEAGGPGAGNRPYTAVHLRLGGMRGLEDKAVRMVEQCWLVQAFAALQCASRVGRAHNHTGPTVLVTDNAILRAALRLGVLQGAAGPPGWALHTAEFATPEAWRASFTDLRLLARAECLVTADSGFSMVAHAWGRQPCVSSIASCVATFKADGALKVGCH